MSVILFRLLQGVGGGALIPLSQTYLAENFEKKEQGKAMAIFSLAIVLGPAIGPYIGGWIVTNYSWPWVFYVNLPIGLFNLILIYLIIEDHPLMKRIKGNVDWLGIIFLTIGLGAMQIVLTDGQYKNWFSSSYNTVRITAGAKIIISIAEIIILVNFFFSVFGLLELLPLAFLSSLVFIKNIL